MGAGKPLMIVLRMTFLSFSVYRGNSSVPASRCFLKNSFLFQKIWRLNFSQSNMSTGNYYEEGGEIGGIVSLLDLITDFSKSLSDTST